MHTQLPPVPLVASLLSTCERCYSPSGDTGKGDATRPTVGTPTQNARLVGENAAQNVIATHTSLDGLNQMVEQTVRHMLLSDCHLRCFREEKEKANVKRMMWFSRAIRLFRKQKPRHRPNMIMVTQTIEYACRKLRTPTRLEQGLCFEHTASRSRHAGIFRPRKGRVD